MDEQSEILNSVVLELRRGTIILSVLSQLDQPQYGYYLVQKLGEKGLNVDPGTLYPLLRRLEKQGLLNSNWDTSETRPRKYYLLNREGREVYRKLRDEWKTLIGSIENLMNEGGS
jgi:PadR family transcriptional regulator, regulatory protein PadR